MYDLCSRPEQPEPAPQPPAMGSRGEGQATERPQQEPSKSEVEKHGGISDRGDVTATARNTTASLLGKRHHSLYANLNGFEVDEKDKVSVDQSLLVGDIIVQVKKNKTNQGAKLYPSLSHSPELQEGALKRKKDYVFSCLFNKVQRECLVF